MSPEELSRITEALSDVVSEKVARKLVDEKRAKWVDPDTHDSHHAWVKQKMKDEEDRRTMRRKVIESGLAWAFPLFLGFLGMSVWQYFRALLGKP